MGIGAMVLLGVAVLAVLYGVGIYNRLVEVKHNVDKGWSNIDVLLKQRHDELPKLVEVCKQHKEFEQATLEKVVTARNQVQTARQAQNMGALGQAEGALRSGLGQIFAIAEAYPELKANQSFMQLQGRISQLEDSIANRREFYNEAVNIYNVLREQFPNNIVAGRFDFPARQLLVFAAADTQDVDVKALFN